MSYVLASTGSWLGLCLGAVGFAARTVPLAFRFYLKAHAVEVKPLDGTLQGHHDFKAISNAAEIEETTYIVIVTPNHFSV